MASPFSRRSFLAALSASPLAAFVRPLAASSSAPAAVAAPVDTSVPASVPTSRLVVRAAAVPSVSRERIALEIAYVADAITTFGGSALTYGLAPADADVIAAFRDAHREQRVVLVEFPVHLRDNPYLSAYGRLMAGEASHTFRSSPSLVTALDSHASPEGIVALHVELESVSSDAWDRVIALGAGHVTSASISRHMDPAEHWMSDGRLPHDGPLPARRFLP